ncbi:MAG: hypothetical protein J0J15_35160, partial [Mesorhizobium sp.]|nr:hypothetical protein [Mesorhizobium sp.]
ALLTGQPAGQRPTVLTPTGLVSTIEGKHAFGGPTKAHAGHDKALDFHRNPCEDVIDAPGTVPFDPTAILVVDGAMTGRFAPAFPPGICWAVLSDLVSIHDNVLSSCLRRCTGTRPSGIGDRHGTRRPELDQPPVRQFLVFPIGALAAGLTWLPKGLSVFACFGFRISRLRRFCPLAMAERPFEQGCFFAIRRFLYRFEAVLRGHPLMALRIVADAVLM